MCALIFKVCLNTVNFFNIFVTCYFLCALIFKVYLNKGNFLISLLLITCDCVLKIACSGMALILDYHSLFKSA